MKMKQILLSTTLFTTLLFGGTVVHAATDIEKGNHAKTESMKVVESSSKEGKTVDYYEKEMDKVKAKQLANKKLMNLYTTDTEALEEENEELASKISSSENRLKAISKQVVKKKKDLKATQQELLELHKKIDKTQSELNDQEESFKKHIKSMKNMNPSTDVLEVVLSSDNFGDMVNKLISYRSIVKADNKVIEEYITLSELLEQRKSDAETLLANLEERLSSLALLEKKESVEKSKLSTLKKQNEFKNMLVSDVVSELKHSNTLLAKKAAELKDKKAETKKLEKLKLKAQKEQGISNEYETTYQYISTKDEYHPTEQSNKEISQGKIFITPITGRYTSGFDHRQLSGSAAEFHFGQDIANTTGTPIQAAADGEIIHASVMGSYGNVVFIKHHIEGVDYVTVYGHMSVIGVKVGDVVKQGETVGLVGSTGRSTGPHVHFEIQVGTSVWNRDKAVDPIEYLDKVNSKTVLKEHKEAEKKRKAHEKKLKEQEEKIKEQNKKTEETKKALEEYEAYIEKQKEKRKSITTTIEKAN